MTFGQGIMPAGEGIQPTGERIQPSGERINDRGKELLAFLHDQLPATLPRSASSLAATLLAISAL